MCCVCICTRQKSSSGYAPCAKHSNASREVRRALTALRAPQAPTTNKKKPSPLLKASRSAWIARVRPAKVWVRCATRRRCRGGCAQKDDHPPPPTERGSAGKSVALETQCLSDCELPLALLSFEPSIQSWVRRGGRPNFPVEVGGRFRVGRVGWSTPGFSRGRSGVSPRSGANSGARVVQKISLRDTRFQASHLGQNWCHGRGTLKVSILAKNGTGGTQFGSNPSPERP